MEPAEQLKAVQGVLDRLTRFRYLNGWAAVAAGVLSLLAYAFINVNYHVPWIVDGAVPHAVISGTEIIGYTAIIGGLLVLAAILCGAIILLSLPKDLTGTAWRNLLRLTSVYAIYILCGGAMVWGMLNNSEVINLGLLRMIPPMMCVLYGLAQLHAAHISISALKTLGIILLACGLIGCFMPSLGWFLWAVGFGGGHMAIGMYIIKKQPA